MTEVTESPAALLERAADAIEAMAELADGGPWRVDVLRATCAIKTGEGSPYPGDHLANVGNRFTAAWIATMSPVVAPPVVAWLRQAALAYRLDGDNTQDEHALTFARAVLGDYPREEQK